MISSIIQMAFLASLVSTSWSMSVGEQRNSGVKLVKRDTRTMGDRCPFPPNKYGYWPSYCSDVIDEECNCLFGDIIVPLAECTQKKKYKMLLFLQVMYEKQRRVKIREQGVVPKNDAIEHLRRCLGLYRAFLKLRQSKSSTQPWHFTSSP